MLLLTDDATALVVVVSRSLCTPENDEWVDGCWLKCWTSQEHNMWMLQKRARVKTCKSMVRGMFDELLLGGLHMSDWVCVCMCAVACIHNYSNKSARMCFTYRQIIFTSTVAEKSVHNVLIVHILLWKLRGQI